MSFFTECNYPIFTINCVLIGPAGDEIRKHVCTLFRSKLLFVHFLRFHASNCLLLIVHQVYGEWAYDALHLFHLPSGASPITVDASSSSL